MAAVRFWHHSHNFILLSFWLYFRTADAKNVQNGSDGTFKAERKKKTPGLHCILGPYQSPHFRVKHTPYPYWLCLQKIGTTKSSFPLRVIKAQWSLFQTHWRANLCLLPPPPALPLLVSSLCSIEDQIVVFGFSSKSNMPGLVLSERLV